MYIKSDERFKFSHVDAYTKKLIISKKVKGQSQEAVNEKRKSCQFCHFNFFDSVDVKRRL